MICLGLKSFSIPSKKLVHIIAKLNAEEKKKNTKVLPTCIKKIFEADFVTIIMLSTFCSHYELLVPCSYGSWLHVT